MLSVHVSDNEEEDSRGLVLQFALSDWPMDKHGIFIVAAAK